MEHADDPREPDGAVFEWLAEGLNPETPAYLRLLGWNWGGSKVRDRLLANLVTVAGRLRDNPKYRSELIRAENWRYTLVGCSAVLLTRDPGFRDDLLDRFRRGSWVAPQLAVALGLVHPEEASGELETVMRRQGNPKSVFSAYAVLKLLGHRAVDEFEASDLFREAQSWNLESPTRVYGALDAVDVVRRQWDFWSDRCRPEDGQHRRGKTGPDMIS